MCLCICESSIATDHTRSGEEVFNSACKACHATQFPNAPQAHDIAAWQKKYSISENQAKQKYPNLSGKALDQQTMAVLVAKVRNGNKTMPAKGLCNDCSDQEYQNAILYMMQPVKK
ncbi:MAG: cytochrome c5 family protein [Proteobacteria bacterium]|nr:cytochrome c5 family protein [Pseudomonadota bacterium]